MEAKIIHVITYEDGENVHFECGYFVFCSRYLNIIDTKKCAISSHKKNCTICNNKNINKCPKCGDTYTYYDKNVVSFNQHYLFENNEPEISSENTHIKGGKRFFCSGCHKDITTYIKTIRDGDKL